MFPAVAGFSDAGLRMLCRRYGADLTCTEMISAHGLIYENVKTEMLLTSYNNEFPRVVQLFGSDHQIISRAIKLDILSKFDIIDLNFGCPARKIVSTGAGCAMMNNETTLYKIVAEAVNAASGRPVTVKIRAGFTKDNVNAAKIAKIVEEAGASAITIHGRTGDMQYAGVCNLDIIAIVKSSVKIPVIGNGDVTTRKKYLEMLKLTNVDGVAIARAALGYPQIFSEIKNVKINVDPVDLAIEHFDEILKYMPGHVAVNYMKKQAVLYLKRIKNSKKLHPLIFKAESADTLKSILISVKNHYLQESIEL